MNNSESVAKPTELSDEQSLTEQELQALYADAEMKRDQPWAECFIQPHRLLRLIKMARSKLPQPVQPALEATVKNYFTVEAPITAAEEVTLPARDMRDFASQMKHDEGLIAALTEDTKRLRKERDDWRRKYFAMEGAQSRSIDMNGEHIKRIQRLERDKDEIRNDFNAALTEIAALKRGK